MEKPTAANTNPDPVEIPEEGAEPVAENPEEPVGENPETPEEPVEPEPVKKNHDQRRWERILSERAEFKAKVELYERMQQQSQQKPAPGSERPARENFGNDEDYVDALVQYKLEARLEPMQRELAAKQEQAKVEESWNAKIAQARTDYPDMDEVLSEAQSVPVSPAMAEAIKSSDLGGDLVYFLGKDPDLANKIARMSPIAAARELGRIESYIEYEKAQKKAAPKPAVSKAPAPIKPPKSSNSAGVKSVDEMSPSEYIAFRNKQVGKRR